MTLVPCETRLQVPPEWTDQNGHMNVAYYVFAFDRATDTLYDRLGIGWSYLERERRSLFTLAMNVDYLGEVFAADRVLIVSRLIDHDHKRIHYFHEMRHEAKGYVAATNEVLAIHVDMTDRKSAPLPTDVQARLAKMKAVHATLPLPPQIGRRLGIRRE